MKKFSAYILIITILAGLLGSAITVNAQTTPDGFCFNGKGEQLIPTKTTSTECAKMTGGIFMKTTALLSDCSTLQLVMTLGTCQAVVSLVRSYGTNKLEGESANATITNSTYHLLAPLPEVPLDFSANEPDAFGDYLNIMIKLFIGLCAVLAVIMIVIGGIEYMTSELPGTKSHGKERITGAVFGLVLALGAYALLNTINPSVLNTNVAIDPAIIQVDIGNDIPQMPVNGKYGIYPIGTDWGAVAGPATDLQQWRVTIQRGNGDCIKVGQPNCTSTRGLDPSILETIRLTCPTCLLILTGGTEFWLHSLTTSHRPRSSTVDLVTTDSLTSYIMDKNTTPVYMHRYSKNGTSFLYEGTHWHAGP